MQNKELNGKYYSIKSTDYEGKTVTYKPIGRDKMSGTIEMQNTETSEFEPLFGDEAVTDAELMGEEPEEKEIPGDEPPVRTEAETEEIVTQYGDSIHVRQRGA